MTQSSDNHTAERPRILMVDDEPFTLRSLQRFFRSHGHSVLLAENARQGLELIEENPQIQIVISDYHMPGVNGVEFLREVSRVRADIRRVILSAFDDSATLLAAMNEGGVHRYLVKPWDGPELLEAVEEQLEEFRSIEKNRLYVIELARQHQMLALSNQQLDALIVERTSKLLERELALQEANERLRQLTGHLELLREEERRAIALNIHDDLAQALTAVQLTIAPHLQDDAAGASGMVLHKVKAQVDNVITTVQRILSNLRPQVLDELGLEAALDWLAKDLPERFGTECRLSTSLHGCSIPTNIATCIYRIAQESLTNVNRHAKASRVEIRLWHEQGSLCLEVEDNGIGTMYRKKGTAVSFGIIGMQERAALCGGTFSITPAKGSGTLVSVCIPLADKETTP